ncbi:MAG TPA: PKD domain-containing protein [Bacteroidales bacterium]|nr:PKD domain-containing protein [Bacteroidales bacterium]
MKNLAVVLLLSLISVSAIRAQSADIGVVSIVSPLPFYCGTDEIVPSVYVKNFGTSGVASFTVVYRVDYFPLVSKNFNTVIPAGDSVLVSFDPLVLNSGSHAIQFSSMNPDGKTDSNNANNSCSASFEYANGKQVSVAVLTDAYGSETSWVLNNSSGTTIASGGSYASNTLYTQTLCLAPGCYQFIIYDSYGDGICAGYGDGYFLITDMETETQLATGCDFTNMMTADFCVTAAPGLPVANFSKSDVNQCTGSVQFFDNSLCNPVASSWLWNFGDGTTSNQQNPTHIYYMNGLYTVSLQVTNANGSSTLSIPNFVSVERIAPPVIDDIHFCQGANISFFAPQNQTLNWYSAPGQLNPVQMGPNFSIAALTHDTTLYYSYQTISPSIYFGLKDNSGAGGYFNFSIDRAVYLDALDDVVIKSAQVYASGAGNRTITLKNSSGQVLDTRVVNIPDGGSRIDLNFEIPQGNGYAIHVNTANNLSYTGDYGGPNVGYPFTVPGIISITGNNYSNSFWYFFYDIEIQQGFEGNCMSAREPVTAIMSPQNVSLGPNISLCYGNSIELTPGEGYADYLWNTGSTEASIETATTGLFTVTVTDIYGCDATGAIQVTTAPEMDAVIDVTHATDMSSSDGSISITEISGQGPFTIEWSNGATTFSIQNLASGEYLYTITDVFGCQLTGAVVVQHSVGVEPNRHNNKISLYPNPAGQMLFVDGIEDASEYRITDLRGAVLLHGTLWNNGDGINIQSLPEGVYFIEIGTGINMKRGKVSKY